MALGMKLQLFHDFIVSQKRLKHKEPNHIIYRNMSRKPQSHVRFLIYRLWAIVLTTVFIIFHDRDAALIQGDACEPFLFFFFLRHMRRLFE